MYWAHSDSAGRSPTDPSSNWQPLSKHLEEVGELAHTLARAASPFSTFAQRAQAAGLLHDIGKFTDRFQSLLFGKLNKAPHSIFGASIAYTRAKAVDVALAIAGHHAGIPDLSDLNRKLKELPPDMPEVWPRAVSDIPTIDNCFSGVQPLLGSPSIRDALEFDLHCRMLLSCLVDADRLNTAANAGEMLPPSLPLEPSKLLRSLLESVERRAIAAPDGAVKRARQAVLSDCLSAAVHPGPLFSLTVPTGGGKTLSGMAFALRHAELNPEIRRIIIVIPFLSIIEQNAKVYRDAFGDAVILEHHSGAFTNSDSTDGNYSQPARRTEFENWDAPIIITTSVRFFETLFSNRPSELRRLHNIARSIVILDEVQTLPRRYVKPALSMLTGLAQNWQSRFVFCTATQPALEQTNTDNSQDVRFPPGTLTEIVSDPPSLFTTLRRVATEWRPDPLSWAEIADVVSQEHQALVIVNSRRAAADLFQALHRRNPNTLHLSNNMCPAHRLARLAEVNARLRQGRPCLVVSTQLVEAGVDLDFPVVWRAFAPLDSIAQAAGRCDREGKLTQSAGHPAGRLIVFTPADNAMPPGEYREGTEITRAFQAAGALRWDDPATIRQYFDRYYRFGENLDSADIQLLRSQLKFATVAESVSWIDSQTNSVLIPYNQDARELINQIRFAGVSLGRFRQAQRFTVNLLPTEFNRARAIGSALPLSDDGAFWVAPDGLYRDDLGLQTEGTGFMA